MHIVEVPITEKFGVMGDSPKMYGQFSPTQAQLDQFFVEESPKNTDAYANYKRESFRQHLQTHNGY